MNEYLKEFRSLLNTESYKQQMWTGRRRSLVEKYSWAIPTPRAIERLADFNGVIEMGAGNGYWASLVQDGGGFIEPYDIEKPKDPWTPVSVIDSSRDEYIVRESGAEALLLCWPPYDNDMGYRFVEAFGGDYIVYIGELNGCTGDAMLHDYLDGLELDERIEIPSYEGIHDNVYIYSSH